MTIKNRFNKLVRVLLSRQTVEKLARSNDPYRLYKKEKEELISQVDELKEEAKKELEHEIHIFGKSESNIFPKNVLEICLIFIMTGIDDYSYFYHWLKVTDSLQEVTGDLEPLAQKIVDLYDKESDLFSKFSEKELIEKIFR